MPVGPPDEERQVLLVQNTRAPACDGPRTAAALQHAIQASSTTSQHPLLFEEAHEGRSQYVLPGDAAGLPLKKAGSME